MVWLESTIAVAKATSTIGSAASSVPAVRRQIRRIYHWILRKNIEISVFGAGGVGKSTVGMLLGGRDPLDLPDSYEESREKDQFSLPGDVPGQVVVAPGQRQGGVVTRVDRFWPSMYKSIVEGRSRVIINVVSYGYHSFNLQSYKNHNLYKEGTDVTEFMREFLADRRGEELVLARALANGITAAPGPISMFSLVNKQDLWWDDIQSVRNFYVNEYEPIFSKIARSVGEQKFRHEIIPVSLTMGNLRTASGEVLAKTTGGYDLVLHRNQLRHMLSAVESGIKSIGRD